MEINEITGLVIGAAIRVHRALGPGLMESAYEACLFHELLKNDVSLERQKAVPVVFDGVRLDCGYRADLVIERKVLVELKAIERFDAIHTAQVLTYLRLLDCEVGLLINFNVVRLVDGIRRLTIAPLNPPT